MSIDMIMERGYQSALSACPEPAAAFAAVPAAAAAAVRPRGVGVGVRPHLDTRVAAVQGTGLSAAAATEGIRPSVSGRIVADVPSMTLVQFVQQDPGDTALRPPG